MQFILGCGMVAGNRLDGLEEIARWMPAEPIVVASVAYGLGVEYRTFPWSSHLRAV